MKILAPPPEEEDLVVDQSAARMISYVECLGGEGAGPGAASACWNSEPDDDLDRLVPRPFPVLQPKTDGSLRRRLLSAKLHRRYGYRTDAARRHGDGYRTDTPHHYGAVYGADNRVQQHRDAAAIRSAEPPSPDKPLLPHHRSPWLRPQPQPLPPQPRGSFSSHGKLFLPSETFGRAPPLPIPNFAQRRRTGSFPQKPEPRPCYAVAGPSPVGAPPSFKELEVPPQYRYRPSRRRRNGSFWFPWRRGRSTERGATQTTPLLHRGMLGRSRLFQLAVIFGWEPQRGRGLTDVDGQLEWPCPPVTAGQTEFRTNEGN